ncbi:MAG: hypothetical protein VB876_11590 [Pirellulales bacterium]
MGFEYGSDRDRVLMRRSTTSTKARPDGALWSEIEPLIGGQWVPYPEGKNIRHSAVAAWVERYHRTEEEAMEIEKNKTKDSN